MKYINEANHENAALHVSTGNRKTGLLPYFSINPGEGYAIIANPKSKHAGHAVGNMPGTCGGVCSGCEKHCYAKRDYMLHNNSAGRSWNENTYLAMKEPARLKELLNAWIALNEPRYFRIHEAGEFFNFRYFLLWGEVARENPATIFYAYTKHSDFLKRYTDEYGELPANLVILVSIWKDTVENFTGAPEFIYDDGTEESVKYVTHCPAVTPEGKQTGVTCIQCKKCMRAKPGDKIAVYAH